MAVKTLFTVRLVSIGVGAVGLIVIDLEAVFYSN